MTLWLEDLQRTVVLIMVKPRLHLVLMVKHLHLPDLESPHQAFLQLPQHTLLPLQRTHQHHHRTHQHHHRTRRHHHRTHLHHHRIHQRHHHIRQRHHHIRQRRHRILQRHHRIRQRRLPTLPRRQATALRLLLILLHLHHTLLRHQVTAQRHQVTAQRLQPIPQHHQVIVLHRLHTLQHHHPIPQHHLLTLPPLRTIALLHLLTPQHLQATAQDLLHILQSKTNKSIMKMKIPDDIVYHPYVFDVITLYIVSQIIFLVYFCIIIKTYTKYTIIFHSIMVGIGNQVTNLYPQSIGKTNGASKCI